MKYYFGENFLINDILDEDKVQGLLDKGAATLDTRTGSVTYGLKTDDWSWYHNYISFQQFLSNNVPDARISYLLDLGYVPVIYLPSCVATLASSDTNMTTLMFKLLDASPFEYVTTRPMSFVRSKCDIDTMDAWVHKLQAADILECSPESVRSLDIIRRVYG